MEFVQQVNELSARPSMHISWISVFLRKMSVLLEINPFLTTIVCFGLVPLAFSLIIIFLTSYHLVVFKMFIGIIPLRFTIPALLAYSWIIIGPRLIYKYEIDLLPLFLWKVRRFVPRESYLQLIDEASRFSSLQKNWGPFVFIGAIVMGWLMYPYAKMHFYIPHIYHPFYIMSVLYMAFSMFIATFGLCGVIVTVKLIRKLAKTAVFIDVTDPFKKGGFGFVLEFAIKTTLLFASGFAVIPFLYNLSIWIIGPGQILGLIFVGLFLCLVLISFLWPVISTYAMIKRLKSEFLTQVFFSLLEKVDEPTKGSSSMDIFLLTWYTQRLEMIKAIPLDGVIVFQFFTSIGVPIIITLIQYHLMR